MNEYVCRFCPPGARTYTQVLGAGCGNLGKHMKSQHEGDIEYWLKQHRGIELIGNTLDNYANCVGPRGSNLPLNG
jgi:hypothetical protein